MRNIEHIKIYCDGGSRGNPGPSAAGVVFLTSEDEVINKFCKFLGNGTNNQAEYSAVLLALDKLRNYHYQKASFYLDSELVVKQLHGQYRVKDPALRDLFFRIQALIQDKNISFTHIRRDLNKLADEQVNICLDKN